MIQLHDKQFVPFISAKEIEFAIQKMVQQVEDDFIDETCIYRSFKRLLYGGF
jgi:hypoxanthine phosphoribosyltransferase